MSGANQNIGKVDGNEEHNDETDNPWNDLNYDDPELLRLLDDPVQPIDVNRLRSNEQHLGFDNNVGDTWIYPNNLPCRQYQLTIAKAALYRNTLVVLPTGLGKTFIAAVVMYNIFRWYPKGKVIFMAPTRPLVAQQIEACQRIMPFPSKDTVELTGKLQRQHRRELWHTKRVFFATPQVVQSDIAGNENDSSSFPFAQVKLIVFDEAHKARGRYAYTEVAQAIWQRQRNFRVLALSATPGRTCEDVAEVVRNLFISHLEIRFESSIDVMSYIHHRRMQTVLVMLSTDIKDIREQLHNIIDPFMRSLIDADVLSGSLSNINRNFLLYEQKRYRNRSQQHHSKAEQNSISKNFSICISLYHAVELLERHGLRVFLQNFEQDEEMGERPKFVMNMIPRLRDLVARLRTQLGPNPFDVPANAMTNGRIAEMPKDLDFGHPKFEEARSCLVKHFEENFESRAIVFCEYRESVMLIYRMLLQHVPLLKPRCFVGQGGASSSGSLRAVTQKQQIQIMSDFREGICNILVATCIGEEGIDVGEVELIVCFDISTANPTRFIQRIGRTGRKKNGNVIMLVTEGREQQLLKDVLAHKDQTNKKLLRSTVVQGALYKHAPRLVPTEYDPQCVHTFVKPPDEEEINIKKSVKTKESKSKRLKATAAKGSQDVRSFFKKIASAPPADLDDIDKEIFDVTDAIESTPKHAEKSYNKIKHFFKDLNTSNIGNITNTQLPCTASVPASTPAKSRPEVDVTRLRNVNKMLKSTAPIVPLSAQIEYNESNILLALKNEKFSIDAKLLWLKMSPEFVREIYDQMQVLNAMEDDNLNDNTQDCLSPEEQKIRETYQVLLDLYGGKQAFEAHLEDIEYEQYKRKNVKQDEWDFGGGSNDEKEFAECLDKIFDGLDEPNFCNDNYDFIQQELKKTDRYKQMMAEQSKESATTSSKLAAPLIAESMIYDNNNLVDDEDDEFNNSIDFGHMTESKYCSQWSMFENRKLPTNSTPLQKPQGPLLKAFQRQKCKNASVITTANESIIIDDDTDNSDEVVFAAVKQPKNSVQLVNTSTPSLHSNTSDTTATIDNIINQADAETNSNANELNLLNELDFDLDVFLEPFPEEEDGEQQQCTKITTEPTVAIKIASRRSSFKENLEHCNMLSNNKTIARHSPDIFALEEESITSPIKNPLIKSKQKLSLAAKLATKQLTTPSKSRNLVIANNHVNGASPNNRLTINTQKHETSPSLFDMYLKNTRGRGKLPTKFHSEGHNITTSKSMSTNCIKHDEDSPIVRKKLSAPKRKIFDSDSETETPTNHTTCEPNSNNSETDCEEIAATQKPSKRYSRQNKKRRRLCSSFFDQEAGVSGGEADSDDIEAEHTIGHYLLDSVVVQSSDDEAEHDHGIYLQSLKSPQQQRGTFKIPAYRVYNDHSQIFSQALPVESSQYIPDSFVVSEDDHSGSIATEADVTMCPLERAELILKERQRAKRQARNVVNGYIDRQKKTKQKKQYHIGNSSDDDD